MVPNRTNEGLLLGAASQNQPGGYSLRSAAATAAVSSLYTRVDHDANDDEGGGGGGGDDTAFDSACAVTENDSTRLQRRRTITATATNDLVAPPAVAGVAAVDEARAARGSPEDKMKKYSSEKRSGHPVKTRLARHRENGISNENVEVFLSLEEEGDGANANEKNDKTVDDGADEDNEERDEIVGRARASEVGGGSSSCVGGGSLLQEGFCLTERPGTTVGFVDNLDEKRASNTGADGDAGFPRQGLDDPRRLHDPKNKGKVPLDARKFQNRGLGQEKNDEPAKVVEGSAQVPVPNRSRDASRGGKAEGKCQEEREGTDAAAFARSGHDEVQEHEAEGEHNRVQGGDKEADKGDNEDKGGKDGEEEGKTDKEECKEDREGNDDGENKEEEEEDKEEEQVQTEEEQRASLETSVRLLRLVLASILLSFRSFLSSDTP